MIQVSGRVTDPSGTPATPFSASFSTGPSPASIGLGALASESFVWRTWDSNGTHQWDPYPALKAAGLTVMRGWVTTVSNPDLQATPPSLWHTLGWQNRYWASIEETGALLVEAAGLGYRLQVAMFFSDIAADAVHQQRPAEWVGLDDAALAAAIKAKAIQTASYFQSLGLAIDTFEVGAETDFGFCGITLGGTVPVPPGVDPVNDPAWMRANLYSQFAPLMRAGIEGLKTVYPNARIALHAAGFGYSRDDVAARGFFESMDALGVPYDVAGFSYPYMSAGGEVPQPYFRQPSFVATLDALKAMGKAVQIVEFDYPAASDGMIHPAAPGYPFTEDGQRDFILDFVNSLRGRVDLVSYWEPDYYVGMDPTLSAQQSCGLWRDPTTPREALADFPQLAAGPPH